MVRERGKRIGEKQRRRLVNEVAWANDNYGNAELEELKPIVVISPKLYDGFLADRTKSFGDATLNATKNTCDLRSAALGYFVDYLFDEEEALKQTYKENDRIKTFLGNKDAWKRVRDLERKERRRNRGGYFVSSKIRSQLLAKRKRDEDEGWSKGELDCNHRSIANTVIDDEDMCRIGESAILDLLVATSLAVVAEASYILYAFISARWLQRVTDILACKFIGFEIRHPKKRDPPGMLPLERQVPILYVQLMDFKGVGLKAPSSGQSLEKLQRASSIRHFRAEMCPHTTLALDVQIQFGMGKRVLDFEKREQIVREDGSKGGWGVTWRTEQVVHGGTYESAFIPRQDLKSKPRALFKKLFDKCKVACLSVLPNTFSTCTTVVLFVWFMR